MVSSDVKILLVDNGSVKPAATLALHRLAKSLSQKSRLEVHPVSLRHATGKPAQTFVPFLRKQLQAGYNRFILLPLFFAETAAIKSFVPEQITLLEQKFGKIHLSIADEIYPLPKGDDRLVTILFDHVQQLIKKHLSGKYNIVLVDHGSPSQKVTAVRQHIAAALQQKFDDIVIEQAVMERREGKKYDFNGQLLHSWLEEKAQSGEESAIVVLMFLQPGRHAGEGGDIEQICARVMRQYDGFKVYITPLVGQHPGLVALLQARLKEVL